MRGKRGIDGRPFRYGGILHDYSADNDEWQETVWSKVKRTPMRCYCCNGVMKNSRSASGELLRQNFPYIGVFKIVKGRDKGYFKFRILCRACAYNYGVGVVEMDAETYQKPEEFSELEFKRRTGYGQSSVNA